MLLVRRAKVQPHFLGITPELVRRWAPSGFGFLIAAGVVAIQFAEPIPRVRKDILSKIPVAGRYWQDEEEEETS
ncbi:9167_t:CDS:2 [Paraglomus occultum]|uniref:9167_t:CDS:1 n=1 Tax=Paraglomus occultum TaxID=144539 RepID=A0A9N8ZBF0_9GLOM|nr:9167_t:CDS:2 [Paraglomus occultum]